MMGERRLRRVRNKQEKWKRLSTKPKKERKRRKTQQEVGRSKILLHQDLWRTFHRRLLC